MSGTHEAADLPKSAAKRQAGTAVWAALAAQKETALKAEHYQAEYNTQHNDLMRKMDHQVETFVGRAEYVASHAEISKRLDEEASQRQLDKDALAKLIAEIRQ